MQKPVLIELPLPILTPRLLILSLLPGDGQKLFEAVGLPYFDPHLFRNTLIHITQERCQTPEQFKAWSQNLVHESSLTTFTRYGHIDRHKQGEVIKCLRSKNAEVSKMDEM